MHLAPRAGFGFEQLRHGLLTMWGSAARAQSHPTLGASALVAPHQFCTFKRSSPAERRTSDKASGVGSVSSLRRTWHTACLLVGSAGLVAGLSLLAASPLVGVLTVLAAMAVTLNEAAQLCGSSLVRQPFTPSTTSTGGQLQDTKNLDSHP